MLSADAFAAFEEAGDFRLPLVTPRTCCRPRSCCRCQPTCRRPCARVCWRPLLLPPRPSATAHCRCWFPCPSAGLDDEAAVAETGRRFADTVLGLGGGREPGAVFRAFRGRDPTPEALLRHNGLLQTAAA